LSLGGPDFVLLTGFLGSGKTTLLRDFLSRPDAADTAIIVNEIGEVDLDGVILRETGGDVSVAMLSNGCVCCQMGSDLAITIDLLLATARPPGSGPLRRIVLETSGLSKPGPVLRRLAALAEHRMRVGVVATFDAVRGLAVTAFEEAVAQWAAAHRIVLTKTDMVSPERAEAAGAEIAALNPLAQIVAADERDAAVAASFAPLGGFAPMPDSTRRMLQASHPRIGLCLARPLGIPGYDDVASWLDNLAGVLGERLLRLKGLVRVRESEAPLLIQSVGTMFSPPRPFRTPGAVAELFLVVIARDVSDGDLAEVTPAGIFAVAEWR
jgi:G3E family GTPase